MKESGSAHSATRLRVGFVFIILFWLPIWLLAPAVSRLLGYSDEPYARHVILVVLACLQGACGVTGAMLVGKEMLPLFKEMPRKKVPKAVWHIMRTGSSELPASNSHLAKH